MAARAVSRASGIFSGPTAARLSQVGAPAAAAAAELRHAPDQFARLQAANALGLCKQSESGEQANGWVYALHKATQTLDRWAFLQCKGLYSGFTGILPRDETS